MYLGFSKKNLPAQRVGRFFFMAFRSLL
jgi:hypothetical protein